MPNDTIGARFSSSLSPREKSRARLTTAIGRELIKRTIYKKSIIQIVIAR